MFCLVSFAVGILPAENTIFQVISFVADLLVALLLSGVSRAVKDAAEIRSIFDNEVLGLNENLTLSGRLKGRIYTVCQNHLKKYQTQTANSGRDNPPGVKDWYEFGEAKELNPILECQNQNAWWEKQLQRKKIIAYGIASVIIIIAMVVLFRIVGIRNAILSSAGFLIMTVDRFVEHIRHYKCSLKLETTLENANDIKDPQELKKLLLKTQAYINERRSIPTVGINFLHRKNAKKLSEQYQATH